MQAIAGIHYNFSMPEDFWRAAWEHEGAKGSLQDFQTAGYLGLIRNFFDRAWLLIYLLGASPAVCASFLAGNRNHPLIPFDAGSNSLYFAQCDITAHGRSWLHEQRPIRPQRLLQQPRQLFGNTEQRDHYATS